MSGLTKEFADRVVAAVKQYVAKELADLRASMLDEARLIGRMELRLRAVEQACGQGKPVDDLIERALDRIQLERAAAREAIDEAAEQEQAEREEQE